MNLEGVLHRSWSNLKTLPARLLAGVITCKPRRESSKMKDQIRTAIDTYVRAWNTGEVDLLDDVFAPDAVYHIPPYPDQDRAGLKQYIAAMRAGYPDLEVHEEETLVEGDKTACRIRLEGTFTGQTPMVPVPPTGRWATCLGCSIIYWKDGRAVEAWNAFDILGFLQQSGVIPALAPTA
jgi:predicted ester cyclase